VSVRTLEKGGAGKRGRYEVGYRELGRHRSRTFDRKADADAFDAQARLKRQRGEAIRRPSETPTLDAFAAEWQRRRAAEVEVNTRKANGSVYDNWIAPYLGPARIGELTVPVLDEWRGDLRAAGASAETQRRAVGLLSMILADAVRRGQIIANPAQALGRGQKHVRRKGRAANVDQVEAMRAHFLAAKDASSAALISVMAYVGLRPEEALALEPANLKGDRFTLREDQTKARTPARSTPIPALVLKEVKKLPMSDKRIFLTAEGNPYSDEDYRNWRRRKFRPAAVDAGLLVRDEDGKIVGDFRPYDLRHLAASLLIRELGPNRLTEIARRLGHSPLTLLNVYAHEIEESEGQPPQPISDVISAARVRTRYGAKRKAVSAKHQNPSRMGSPERDSNS
jgi:integrase